MFLEYDYGVSHVSLRKPTVGTLDSELLEPLLNCALAELGAIFDEFQIVGSQLVA